MNQLDEIMEVVCCACEDYQSGLKVNCSPCGYREKISAILAARPQVIEVDGVEWEAISYMDKDEKIRIDAMSDGSWEWLPFNDIGSMLFNPAPDLPSALSAATAAIKGDKNAL